MQRTAYGFLLSLLIIVSALCAAAQETPTETPTPTQQPVPTPVALDYEALRSSVVIFNVNNASPAVLAVNPANGNLLFQHNELLIEAVPPTAPADVNQVQRVWEFRDILLTLPLLGRPTRVEMGNDGTLFAIGENPAALVMIRDSVATPYFFDGVRLRDIMVVLEGTASGFPIPSPLNPPLGHLLVLAYSTQPETIGQSKLFILNPDTKEVSTYLDYGSLPRFGESVGHGAWGDVFVMTREKMFYLVDGRFCRELFHFVLPGREANSAAYLRGNQGYFITTDAGLHRVDSGSIRRLNPAPIAVAGSSSDATRLYFYAGHAIHKAEHIGPLSTQTPVPTQVMESPIHTPLPTPVPALFVLDGYGGIHSSNAEVRPPVLPYIDQFDIMRDIEPDPLGRGWYMLDGYGGIHTSPNTLPKPQDLPYFGFDIARNLEIEVRDGQTYYYLLDGYGAIHTNAPDFQYGKLPWFGFDNARDLEPDPSRGNEGGWLMLDGYAVIHSSKRPNFDKPLNDSWYNPQARAMIQFQFGETYLLDAFGGRHTNPCYPETNLIKEFTPAFYFPGFEIVWDVEIAKE